MAKFDHVRGFSQAVTHVAKTVVTSALIMSLAVDICKLTAGNAENVLFKTDVKTSNKAQHLDWSESI